MAYVSIKSRKDADSLIHYCFEGLEPGDPVHGEECPDDEDGAKRAFEAIRNLHNFRGGIEAAHVVQSFSPTVSKQLTRETVNFLGRELAARTFPGHQFLVFTHSEDEHLHNHIVVNSVHMETGERITNKFKHLYQLRATSDQICREYGVPNELDGRAKKSERSLGKASRIERLRGASWIFDLRTKADFARGYATNYDEYAGILNEVGINVRIKDKAITYFYPGKDKGKRGRALGPEYMREGLEKQFRRNDALFQSVPGLRERVRDDFARAAEARGQHVQNSVDVLLDGGRDRRAGSKDYAAYTQSRRATGDRSAPTDDRLRNCIIPIEAIRMAKVRDLTDYCNHHRIKLGKNEHGQTVLKERETVVLQGSRWVNQRNSTQGSAIEFAANHGRLTYLQAIARLNDAPGLLELEKHFGEKGRRFQSFHIPLPGQADYPRAIERMGRFLSSFGSDARMAEPLLMSGQAQVRKSGVIRIFAHGDRKHPLEFTQNEEGAWQSSRRRPFRSPFLAVPGTGTKAVVFSDPRHFIEKRGTKLFDRHARSDGILALMEPDPAVVERYLKANPHVKHLDLVSSSPSKPLNGELDFFGNLKSRLQGLGVQVRLTGYEQALRRRGPDMSF